MTPKLFDAILQELIDENPFACRALLKIVSVRFTDSVPTLAVTCTEAPLLLVNLDFVSEHCHTERHVKAVICHEFLHVLLRHTERVNPLGEADHIALDAVINAIIHRELGSEYSDMMLGYYDRVTGIRRLLRPFRRGEITGEDGVVGRAWTGLYDGTLVADDIRDLARDLADDERAEAADVPYLGNHDALGDDATSEQIDEALDRALRSMNGEGIWRSPRGRGTGAAAYTNCVTAADDGVRRWRQQTWAVLRRHLLPDPRAPRTEVELAECRLPVLSPGDRRSFARALWSPLLPDAVWPSPRRSFGATAQVYLDVSGSMYAEMPLIVSLLNQLGRHIKRPFWAFSDVVAPAVIHDGRLLAETTGGTSMSCVLDHLASTRPASAVVVTDGYIEALDRAAVTRTSATRLHVVVTRDGTTDPLDRAGIACTQLGRLPR